MKRPAALCLILLSLSISLYSQQTEEFEIRVQLGHSTPVSSVDISADEKLVISGSTGGTLKLWDMVTGKEIRTFEGHSGSVQCVAFSPDAKSALSGSYDSTVILWDVATGKVVRRFREHSGFITDVAFSPDGRLALSASKDYTIKLWETATGTVVKTLKGQAKSVSCIAFSPDGRLALSGGWDMRLTLWDIKKGKRKRRTKEGAHHPLSVGFSPDGKLGFGVSTSPSYSKSTESTVTVWDIAAGKKPKQFTFTSPTNKRARLRSARFSPDGKLALMGYSDSVLILFDLSTGKPLRSLKEPFLARAKSIRFTPDARQALVAWSEFDDASKTLSLLDLATGAVVKELRGHSASIQSMTAFSDGNLVLSGLKDKTIRLWDISEAKEQGVTARDAFTGSLALTPDGKHVLTATSGFSSATAGAKLLDFSSGKEVVDFRSGGGGRGLAISPDGKMVAWVSQTKAVVINDARTGKQLNRYGADPNEFNNMFKTYDTSKPNWRSQIPESIWYTGVAFSRDWSHLLLAKSDSTIRVMNLTTGRGKDLSGRCWWPGPVTFSPDAKLALISCRTTLRLYDVATGQEIRTFAGHAKEINHLCFSPDGTKALSAAVDRTLKVWDVASGREVETFTGHPTLSLVRSILYTPTTRIALCKTTNNAIRLWYLSNNTWVDFVSGSGKDEGKWIIYTHDGYWDGSADCGDLVAIVRGTENWNIDQFAVRNNRADIVLERLRLGLPEDKSIDQLIAHYRYQYKKRLRRMGISEDQLSSELHVPLAEVTKTADDGKFASLTCSFSDSKYNLKRYNVFANDVPVYGSYGKELTGRSSTLTERVELTRGTNKLEISCTNERGAESYRAVTYADYDGESQSDLYVLAFGVSRYANPQLNLDYAAKDAQDLSGVLAKMKGKGFANVHTKILTDQQVTPAAIKQSKEFLRNAKPDDVFVLSIAGHGMHDNDPEATYYYLTHNADINNLKQTAANFETIEGLLQGIPPRNKLFLMDACESGEIDEEDRGQMLTMATGAGIGSRGIKSSGKVTGGSGSSGPAREMRAYLHQKDRFIYNDLIRRSGAIVFSSSRGGELSYERKDIENGLFTESVMKALTSKDADTDGDGTVSTDELRKFVSKDVSKASEGLQNPTVDRDNIYQKFGFVVE